MGIIINLLLTFFGSWNILKDWKLKMLLQFKDFFVNWKMTVTTPGKPKIAVKIWCTSLLKNGFICVDLQERQNVLAILLISNILCNVSNSNICIVPLTEDQGYITEHSMFPDVHRQTEIEILSVDDRKCLSTLQHLHFC